MSKRYGLKDRLYDPNDKKKDQQYPATTRPDGPRKVKLVQVIMTEAARGEGTKEDPCRPVTQYWTIDGELIGERDEVLEAEAAEKIIKEDNEIF